MTVEPIFVEREGCGSASFYQQDCREFLRQLRDKPALIFADPPFNFDEAYEHGDSMADADYTNFMHEWMTEAVDCLAPGGALWINVPDEHVSMVDRFIDYRCSTNDFGEMRRRNWIIWHFRFGQHTYGRFVRSKSHLLYYVKEDPEFSHTFNAEDIAVESVRSQIGDSRADPFGRTPMDVWGFEKFWGRVQGNNRERVPDAPNQLPEMLLERIIRACTDEGDLVVDPFCGSGTTAVVAAALGRNVATCDIGERVLGRAIERARGGSVRCG